MNYHHTVIQYAAIRGKYLRILEQGRYSNWKEEGKGGQPLLPIPTFVMNCLHIRKQ